MVQRYIDRIIFAENVEKAVGFKDADSEGIRIPYDIERAILRFVVQGQPDELKAYCSDLMENSPEMNIVIGNTSKDKIRRIKYHVAAGIIAASRAAMLGGAPENECHKKSDRAILQMDELNQVSEIYKVLETSIEEYAELVRQTKIKFRYPQVVRKCVQYISAHIHQNISLDELAEGSGYSKEYVAKLFKKHMDVTISEYIQSKKVEEAIELIRGGTSCGEVANILGYSSQSYFISQFKKRVGVTPGKFQNMLKIDGKNIK